MGITVPEYEYFNENGLFTEEDQRQYFSSFNPAIYSRPQVSTSLRLTDTQRAHTPMSQSSVVRTSQVQQQQQPEHKTRNWRPRSTDISNPHTRDKRFFRMVLRQDSTRL